MTKSNNHWPDSSAGLSRRSFLKGAGAGALALSLGPLAGPWVQAAETITIGMANPLETFFGQAAEKALLLGIKQINASGGLLGKNLDLITSDTAGRPDQALLAVEDLANRGADFLTGFFFSEALIGTIPAIPVVRKILLDTGASTPVLTIQVSKDYNNFKFFFRLGPVNSFFLLQLSVGFVRDFLEGKLGWKKIVLLAEDSAWTKPITDSFQTLLGAFGSKVQVVDVIRYAESTTDFTSLFSRAVKAGSDGLFTIMAHTGTRPTAQWAAQKVPLPLVGINVQAQQGNFDQLTNGAAESVVTLTSAARAPVTKKTIPFVDDFAAFSDVFPQVTIPSYNAFSSYDALFMLKEAVEKAGTLPDNEANTDKIIAELEQFGALKDGKPTDLFVGTTGHLGFYQRGEIGVTPLMPKQAFPHDLRFGPGLAGGLWIQWQSGKQQVISPANLKTAGFVLPPWMR